MDTPRSTIADKLDFARRDLLDLGLRNTLLNYRLSKRRGVEVVDSDANEVFQRLVTEERPLHFIPAPEKEAIPSKELNRNGTSVRGFALQTAFEDKSLQARLLSTYYAARTHIEERGVNILFLAIGSLHWFENENSDKKLRAPLLLVPVKLERTSAREKLTLKYTEEDVEDSR